MIAGPTGLRCATSSTTGRRFRDAESSSGWRWRSRRGLCRRCPRQRRPGEVVPCDGGAVAHDAVVRDTILRAGKLWISQTSNILLYLGRAMVSRRVTRRRTLGASVAAHDRRFPGRDPRHASSHRLGPVLRGAKPEARRRSGDFRANRAPKFLRYFDGVIERSGDLSSPAGGSPTRISPVSGDRRAPLRISEGCRETREKASTTFKPARPGDRPRPVSPPISRARGGFRSISREFFAVTSNSTIGQSFAITPFGHCHVFNIVVKYIPLIQKEDARWQIRSYTLS